MNKERAAGLLFLGTGIYGFIFSSRFPFGTWQEPGPAIFPLGISILLIVAGVLTFLFGKSKAEGKIDWHGVIGQLGTPMKIVGLTAGYILVLDRVGYLLTSSFFIFLLVFWVSGYRWWVAMGLAIAIGIGSWHFFWKNFSRPIATGIFAFAFLGTLVSLP